jgi:DNA-directed RNA polymerase specialized sigma24 family protein
VDDADLVRAIRAGDRSAFTAMFDRHAARVHDLALAMLRDRSAALEVVETTFLEAGVRVQGLEEEHRLQVWLLAITRRNGALRAGPTAGVDRQPSLPNDDPERVHLAGLVWEAVADLPLRDRTLLDLELRQGLDGHDLADALGVTLSQSQDLQARMRDRIEKGLSGYLIARTADGRCPELTKVLKGWDGRFTPKDSLRIANHVDGCKVCNQTRFTLPSPFALYAAALPAPFPAVVRPRVIERVALPVDPLSASAPAAAPVEDPDAAPYMAPIPAAVPASADAPTEAVASPFQEPPPPGAPPPYADPPVPPPYPEAPPVPPPYPAAPPAPETPPLPDGPPAPEAPPGPEPGPDSPTPPLEVPPPHQPEAPAAPTADADRPATEPDPDAPIPGADAPAASEPAPPPPDDEAAGAPAAPPPSQPAPLRSQETP